MKRRTQVMSLLVVLALTACGGPIKIESARRTVEYNKGTLDRFRIPYQDQNKNVFLIVELRDPPPEVWKSIEMEDRSYFIAGEKRFNVLYSAYQEQSQTVPGRQISRRIVLAAVVPLDALEFQLHVGDYPTKAFKAEREVHEHLEVWPDAIHWNGWK